MSEKQGQKKKQTDVHKRGPAVRRMLSGDAGTDEITMYHRAVSYKERFLVRSLIPHDAVRGTDLAGDAQVIRRISEQYVTFAATALSLRRFADAGTLDPQAKAVAMLAEMISVVGAGATAASMLRETTRAFVDTWATGPGAEEAGNARKKHRGVGDLRSVLLSLETGLAEVSDRTKPPGADEMPSGLSLLLPLIAEARRLEALVPVSQAFVWDYHSPIVDAMFLYIDTAFFMIREKVPHASAFDKSAVNESALSFFMAARADVARVIGEDDAASKIAPLAEQIRKTTNGYLAEFTKDINDDHHTQLCNKSIFCYEKI